jgi:hypothetical protein
VKLNRSRLSFHNIFAGPSFRDIRLVWFIEMAGLPSSRFEFMLHFDLEKNRSGC